MILVIIVFKWLNLIDIHLRCVIVSMYLDFGLFALQIDKSNPYSLEKWNCLNELRF